MPSLTLNKEAALIIGLIFTVITGAVEQLSGPGIIDTNDWGGTITRVGTILVPLIAAAFTRYQVYSKSTVAALTGTTVNNLPPPP